MSKKSGEDKRLYTIEYLEFVLDHMSHEVYMKDKDGKYIYINKKGSEKIGLPKDEIIGKIDRDIRFKSFYEKCEYSDKTILQEDKELFYEHKLSDNIDEEFYRVYKFPIKDDNGDIKFIGACCDNITYKNKIDKELNNLFINNTLNKECDEYTESIKSILDNLSEMISSTSINLFLVDKDTHNLKKYLSCSRHNNMFCNNTQVEIDYKIFSSTYDDKLEINIDSSLNKEFKKKYIRDYDISSNSKLRIFPLKYNSDLIGVMYIYYDEKDNCSKVYDGYIMDICNQFSLLITNIEYKDELRQSLNDYKTKNKNLQDKNDKLEEAIGAEMIKVNFLENMSHEFRTPINIILMTAQLLISILDSNKVNIDREKIINHIKTLKQNGYRVLRLVNNILDTTKFDNGYEELKLGNYNIVSIIEDIVLSTSDYIKNKKITFDTDEEEVILACNPDAIEKIILNLISNSLKFTNENGQIEVDVNVNHEEEKLFVYVRNDGPPISKEYSEKIFDRFVQADNNLRRVSEGSGIGLYLVRLLVQMHNGEIWLNTDVKEGVEFIFYIPIKTINSIDDIMLYNIEDHSIMDKCSIEFSDVYFT